MGVFDFAKATDTNGLLMLHQSASNIVNSKSASSNAIAKARKVLKRIDRHLRERGAIPCSKGGMVGVVEEPAHV